MSATRTKEEMYDQIDKAMANVGRWGGMSYEEGVEAALRWAMGDTNEAPMDDE